MAKWAGNTCGYCGHSAPSLDRYECPECKRTGCVSCMPEAGNSPCNQCQEEAEFRRQLGWTDPRVQE